MKQSKRDLITAAFHNQETGRMALGFWHHFLKDETGADAFLHPELTDEVIQGQEDFYQAFSPDMIKIMTDGFFSYPAEILQKPLTSRKALSEIKPLGKSSVWFESQIAYAKLLQKKYGSEVPLFYNVFAVPRTIEFMQQTAGSPIDLGAWVREEPETLTKAMDIISTDYAELAKALISEAGVDGIYLSVNNVSPDGITEEEYRKYIAPYELKILEAANEAGGSNILHICGYHGFRNHLEWYKDYPFLAVNVANHVEGITLGKEKKLFGGRAVIGGFGQTENDLIYKGSEKEIRSEVRRLLDESGTKGVLLGADCTIPRDTDIRHLEWIRDEADKYVKGHKA